MRRLILILISLLIALPTLAQERAPVRLEPVVSLPVGFELNLADPADVGTRLAWSPDGTMIATLTTQVANSAETVTLWDSETGESLATLGIPNRLTALAFSPDGSLLALGGGQYFVMLVDVGVLLELGDVPADTLEVAADENGLLHSLISTGNQDMWTALRWMAFSPAGDVLVTADHFGLTLWDVAEPNYISLREVAETPHRVVTEREVYPYFAITMTANGLRLFTREPDGPVVYSVLQPDVNADPLFTEDTAVEGFAGRYFASSGDGRALAQFLNEGLWINFPLEGDEIIIPAAGEFITQSRQERLALNHDGSRLVMTGSGRVSIWDAASGDLLANFFEQAINNPQAIQFSPADDTLAMIYPNRIDVWRLVVNE